MKATQPPYDYERDRLNPDVPHCSDCGTQSPWAFGTGDCKRCTWKGGEPWGREVDPDAIVKVLMEEGHHTAEDAIALTKRILERPEVWD